MAKKENPTRTALVTGANRGIGLAIARQLAAGTSTRVLVAARTAEKAETAAAKVDSQAIGVELDLSDPGAASERIQQIESTQGSIDILVNNAGILTSGNALDVDANQLSESLFVNAVAPFALMHAVGPGMKRRGWGRIVNLSSGWGSFEDGLTGPAAYSISKATLNAITLALAPALGPAVKINAACPGWVRTRMGGMAASRSADEGADTPVWLATLPDDGPTGGFYRDRRLISW